MYSRRDLLVTVLLVIAALSIVSRGQPEALSAPVQVGMRTGPGAEWRLVVVGDASLLGLGEAFARQITDNVGVKVTLHDFAVYSLPVDMLRQALEVGDSPMVKLDGLVPALRRADVVIMLATPKDGPDLDAVMGVAPCWPNSPLHLSSPRAEDDYTADLKAIWARIIKLRSGWPTVARALDPYNPHVRAWQRQRIFDGCTPVWERLSASARSAADAYSIPFLSRYDAFNGGSHNEDPADKGYTGSNGSFPTDLAAEYTAELLGKLGYDPIQLLRQ